MILRKKEFQRQKISIFGKGMKRQSGYVQWVMSMFFVLFLGILLCAGLQVKAYRATSLYMEDALAASGLASAIIDVQEYGCSHNLIIADAEEAYERYCVALRGNLQLNEQWEGTNKTLVSGKVTVENYTVYNVADGVVTVYCIGQDGAPVIMQESVGGCVAPNGVPVVSTAIYSEISFPVEGMFGVQTVARKGKLVDIVAEME